MAKRVPIAFDPQGLILPITNILPLKQVKSSIKSTQKYLQVLASVREVGIIEPLIVFPQNGDGRYLLLDGHIRLEVLKQIGETQARCLVATDDETYTYNKRVSRMATIQEHAMILKATRSGVSEERVLAQPEMEKRRFPVVKIPPLRGGDFQGMGVYRPMLVPG